MTFVGLAVANLRARKLRTLVNALSVTLASALLTLSFSALLRVRENGAGFDERDLQIMSARSDSGVPLSVAREVNRLIPDADVDWNLSCGAELQGNGTSYHVFAISDGFFLTWPTVVVHFAPEAYEAWRRDRASALLSSDLVALTGWRVGQVVTVSTDRGQVRVRIVGTTTGSISLAVIMHFDQLNEAQATNRDEVSELGVHVSSDPDRWLAELTAHLDSSNPPMFVTHLRAYIGRITAISGLLPDFLERVGIVFGVCALFLSVSNGLLTLRERSAELGTLFVLGFRRSTIYFLLTCELSMSCGVAGVVGCWVPYAIYHAHGVHMGALALAEVPVRAQVALAVFSATLVLVCFATVVPVLLVLRSKGLRRPEAP